MKYFILSICLLLSGCGSMSTKAVKDSPTSLSVADNMGKINPIILGYSQDNIKIAEQTKDIAVAANAPQEIAVGLDKIKENSVAIDQTVVELKKDTAKVKTLEKQSDAQNQKAIADLYSSLQWFFGISGSMILIGVILAFTVERKLGIVISAIGGVGLALAAGAVFYLKTIATIGMALIVASLVIGVSYGIWRLFLAFRAVKENVKVIEAVKPELTPEAKAKIFGNDVDVGVAGTIQSQSTKTMVKKIRGKK